MIKKSSILLPAASAATIHLGCLPRPAQVSCGALELRYLGMTSGYFRRGSRELSSFG